jgi:hypothetical protein
METESSVSLSKEFKGKKILYSNITEIYVKVGQRIYNSQQLYSHNAHFEDSEVVEMINSYSGTSPQIITEINIKEAQKVSPDKVILKYIPEESYLFHKVPSLKKDEKLESYVKDLHANARWLPPRFNGSYWFSVFISAIELAFFLLTAFLIFFCWETFNGTTHGFFSGLWKWIKLLILSPIAFLGIIYAPISFYIGFRNRLDAEKIKKFVKINEINRNFLSGMSILFLKIQYRSWLGIPKDLTPPNSLINVFEKTDCIEKLLEKVASREHQGQAFLNNINELYFQMDLLLKYLVFSYSEGLFGYNSDVNKPGFKEYDWYPEYRAFGRADKQYKKRIKAMITALVKSLEEYKEIISTSLDAAEKQAALEKVQAEENKVKHEKELEQAKIEASEKRTKELQAEKEAAEVKAREFKTKKELEQIETNRIELEYKTKKAEKETTEAEAKIISAAAEEARLKAQKSEQDKEAKELEIKRLEAQERTARAEAEAKEKSRLESEAREREYRTKLEIESAEKAKRQIEKEKEAKRLEEETKQKEIEKQIKLKEFPIDEHIDEFLKKLDAAEFADIKGETHTRFLKMLELVQKRFTEIGLIEPEKLKNISEDTFRINQYEALIDLYAEKIRRVKEDPSLDDDDIAAKIEFWERLRDKEISQIEG